MSDIYLDATALIALGTVGRLDLLSNFDGRLVVLPAIQAEVTSQPAKSEVEQFISKYEVVTTDSAGTGAIERSRELLEEPETTGDVRLIAGIVAEVSADREVGLVSDDRRLRTLSRGLGARVTGTIGVVIGAVEEGLEPEVAKDLIRRLDDQGLHMTGELRAVAFDLVDEAAQ